jgi:hypothetical protein
VKKNLSRGYNETEQNYVSASVSEKKIGQMETTKIQNRPLTRGHEEEKLDCWRDGISRRGLEREEIGLVAPTK